MTAPILIAEDARRLAAGLQRTDAGLAEVERVREAAVARRDADLKFTRRRESQETR